MGNLRYLIERKIVSIIGLLWKVSQCSVMICQVDIRITNNDGAAPSVTINTSVNTIQVPIPSEEEVTLESTEKLIKRLETAGAKKENPIGCYRLYVADN